MFVAEYYVFLFLLIMMLKPVQFINKGFTNGISWVVLGLVKKDCTRCFTTGSYSFFNGIWMCHNAGIQSDSIPVLQVVRAH